MIAALYVQRGGVYWGLPDVDPWDEARDALLYGGPWPVVAHPPCARWGRYATGGPTVKVRRRVGDDGGMFASALAAVRRWGGVLEHPAHSRAWRAHGLLVPPYDGGWVAAGDGIGWTCHVEQGHYGHRARKATWLYAAGVKRLPSLRWGPSVATARIDLGFHTAEERALFRRLPPGATRQQREWRNAMLARAERLRGKCRLFPERMGRRERSATPIEFRDLLLSIARSTQEVADSESGRSRAPWSPAASHGAGS